MKCHNEITNTYRAKDALEDLKSALYQAEVQNELIRRDNENRRVRRV